jgi:mono/diheme cytochrome c family protein
LEAALIFLCAAAAAGAANPKLPAKLSETGLYADFAARRVAAEVLSFTPQYSLWTDGAAKHRWIRLPAGAAIDAADPDAWVFPVGTRIWKEFAFARAVETRLMELGGDGWQYGTYRWLADGSDAVLASEYGERGVYEVASGVGYDLPSRYDCRACHEGNVSPVLGFSALQLSSDRDPNAVHGGPLPPGDVDLAALVERGLVRGLPEQFVRTPPRIAASGPLERSALGYLHGNCSGCHNDRGALADLGFSLEVRLAGGSGTPPPPGALLTAIGHVARYQPAGQAARQRVAAGLPQESALLDRMASRVAVSQMPPFGTKLVDREAVDLLERWIRSTPSAPDGVSNRSGKEMR